MPRVFTGVVPIGSLCLVPTKILDAQKRKEVFSISHTVCTNRLRHGEPLFRGKGGNPPQIQVPRVQ